MADALDVTWGLLKIFIGLAFVVVLAYYFTRLATHRLPAPQNRSGVRVLGHLFLGGRRGVSLVKLGPHILVLGVTDQQVNLLERISDPGEVAAIEDAAAAPLVNPARLEQAKEFARLFRERLGGMGGSRSGGRRGDGGEGDGGGGAG